MSKEILLVSAETSLTPAGLAFSENFKERWNLTHVGNGAQAMELVENNDYHAVVVDLVLPDCNGTRVLDKVVELRESAQRFILADLSDRQTMLKCVGTSHQFLSKPCDGPKLESALERALQLDLWFGNEHVKKLVSNIRKVPSPPSVYFQIVKELQSPAASMENIGAIISQDMAVTAKLLQMVNSVAFGLQRPVSSPAEAVMYLGIETTKSLVLLAHTYSHFDQIPHSIMSVEALWSHSLATGRLARVIARIEKAGDDVAEQSFTAGLLHDMGKLILAVNQPELYRQVHEIIHRQAFPVWRAEQDVFGTHHGEVGAWLAAIWGLPIHLIEALALHHQPTRFLTEEFSPLTAVHVANVLEHESQPESGDVTLSALDADYLSERGLEERLEEWRVQAEQLYPRTIDGQDVDRSEEMTRVAA